MFYCYLLYFLALVLKLPVFGERKLFWALSLNKKINVYSFALNAQQHQPSGTCNFSRIDNAQLNMNLASPGDVHIFATSYNVLRIMSGMGGLAYSN